MMNQPSKSEIQRQPVYLASTGARYELNSKYVSTNAPELGELTLKGLIDDGFFVFFCEKLKMTITSTYGVFPADFIKVEVEKGEPAYCVIVEVDHEKDAACFYFTSEASAREKLAKEGRNRMMQSDMTVYLVGPVAPGGDVFSAPQIAVYDSNVAKVVTVLGGRK